MATQVQKLLATTFLGAIFWVSPARATVPLLRIKTGMTSLSVDAGQLLSSEKYNSLVTFQPSLMWDVPGFSSRVGIHYLQELGGKYGLTTLSGIGFSFYYYLFGISSSYNITDDDVIFQRSRPGPFVIAGLTPVNFNMNKVSTSASGEANTYFSSIVYDISTGLGYDYPLTRNLLLAGEYVYRTGSGITSRSDAVAYRGSTIYFSVCMTYY